MRSRFTLFLVASSLFATANAFADPDPNFYVFLCFGQSNMDGAGRIEQEDRIVDERFQVLSTMDMPNLERKKGKWYPAVPSLCRPRGGLGPADYFGRTMVAELPTDVKVGVINVAVPGCRIELFEKDTFRTYAATAPTWMHGFINEYNGNPYQTLVDMGKLAQKGGVIKGILLHQGESNPNDQQWPNTVKGIYDNLIKDLHLNAEDVPLLAGETVHADQQGVCAGMNSIITKLPETLFVVYRGDLRLMILREATNLSLLERMGPRAKLSASAVTEFLALVKEYELCRSPPPKSGNDSHQRCSKKSSRK